MQVPKLATRPGAAADAGAPSEKVPEPEAWARHADGHYPPWHLQAGDQTDPALQRPPGTAAGT